MAGNARELETTRLNAKSWRKYIECFKNAYSILFQNVPYSVQLPAVVVVAVEGLHNTLVVAGTEVDSTEGIVADSGTGLPLYIVAENQHPHDVYFVSGVPVASRPQTP